MDTQTAIGQRSPAPLSFRDPRTLDSAERQLLLEYKLKVHRAAGVKEGYLVHPEGHIVWFLSVYVASTVHAQALGFTNSVYGYALAPDRATALAAAYRDYGVCRSSDGTVRALPIERIDASPSGVHHVATLFFPQQVCRLDMPLRPAFIGSAA